MKKKFCFFILIFIFSKWSFVYADDSMAVYAGKTYEMDLDYSIQLLRKYFVQKVSGGRPVYEIEKLTKKEKYLLEDALDEYELAVNDVYKVRISIDKKILMLVVQIDSVNKSGTDYNYSWWSIGELIFF